MQIHLTYQESNYDYYIKNLFDLFDVIIRIPKYFLGIVGLILAIPIIAIISSFSFIIVFLKRRALKSIIIVMFDEIGNATDKELIDSHLNFERLAFSFRDLINRSKNTKDFFLYKPIYNQVYQMFVLLNEAESTLKKAAYPELNNTISDEQKEELTKKFQSFQDWDDDELDIYDEVYCK